MNRVRGFLFLAAALTAAGCAVAPHGPGDDLLRHGDFAAAIPVIQQALVAQPDNPVLNRNLGIALLETGKPEAAATALERARSLDPRDPVAAFQLGRAAEAAGSWDAAARAYGDYLALGGKQESAVRVRLNTLSHRRAEAEVKAALARERSLSAASVPENTLAVPDFVNVAASDTLAPLSRGLSAVLVTDLSQVGAFRVLERDRLQVLLDELNLSHPNPEASTPAAPLHDPSTALGLKERLAALRSASSGKPYYSGPVDDQRDAGLEAAVREFQGDHGLKADGVPGPRTLAALAGAVGDRPPETPAKPAEVAEVAPDTAPRLGKLIGARRFVQGAFAPLGASAVRLDASVIATHEGTLTAAGDPVNGPLPRVLHLEKDLLAEILAALGITPTPAEEDALARIPTENFDAFMAWSRGLVFQDQGRRAEALAAFREAVRLDPGFNEARASEELAAVTPDDQDELDRAELDRAFASPPAGATDRLLRSGAWTGLGPGPDLDRWADTDPTVTETEKLAEGGGDATGTIEVGGTLPGRNRQ